MPQPVDHFGVLPQVLRFAHRGRLTPQLIEHTGGRVAGEIDHDLVGVPVGLVDREAGEQCRYVRWRTRDGAVHIDGERERRERVAPLGRCEQHRVEAVDDLVASMHQQPQRFVLGVLGHGSASRCLVDSHERAAWLGLVRHARRCRTRRRATRGRAHMVGIEMTTVGDGHQVLVTHEVTRMLAHHVDRDLRSTRPSLGSS